jgi:hypothetical protein
MNTGSSDLFNFKPHELTLKNPVKDFSWPRLAIQLSKELIFRLLRTTPGPKGIGRCVAFCDKKNTPRQIVGASNLFTPNLSFSG